MAQQIVSIDADPLLKVAQELQQVPKAILPAMVSAINRTMDSTITQIKKEVSSEYTIKQKDIAKAIKRTRANKARLSSVAVAEGGEVALYKFRHTPTSPPPKQRYKQPVKAQVKKSGGKKVVISEGNKAFVQTVNGNHMIFARKKGAKRLPIKKLYSLSVPQMIADKNDSKGSIKRIQARAQEMLEKKINQEITYRLSKIKGGNK